jgi:hypothetical protein
VHLWEIFPPLRTLSTFLKPLGVWTHKARWSHPTGVLLSAGNDPKNATNVKNEIVRMAMARFRRRPIFVVLIDGVFELEHGIEPDGILLAEKTHISDVRSVMNICQSDVHWYYLAEPIAACGKATTTHLLCT